MSILVYRDRTTTATAAAMLVAAQMIEKPRSVLGLDYAPELVSVYRKLADMSAEGLLDWSDVTAFALAERVLAEGGRSIGAEMTALLYRYTNINGANRFAPGTEAANWSVACREYEDAILRAGGLDAVLLAIRADGSIVYNIGAAALAPVTHVEPTAEGRAVTVGLSTVMAAGKVIAVLVGEDKAELAGRILKGPVTSQVPASYLQLHANAVFLLDEAAAAAL